jgi:hypothetical protein
VREDGQIENGQHRTLSYVHGDSRHLAADGAITAVIDRDTLMAISWFCFAAFAALPASGLAHGSQGVAYLAIGVLVVAVAISIGAFITD